MGFFWRGAYRLGSVMGQVCGVEAQPAAVTTETPSDNDKDDPKNTSMAFAPEPDGKSTSSYSSNSSNISSRTATATTAQCLTTSPVQHLDPLVQRSSPLPSRLGDCTGKQDQSDGFTHATLLPLYDTPETPALLPAVCSSVDTKENVTSSDHQEGHQNLIKSTRRTTSHGRITSSYTLDDKTSHFDASSHASRLDTRASSDKPTAQRSRKLHLLRSAKTRSRGMTVLNTRDDSILFHMATVENSETSTNITESDMFSDVRSSTTQYKQTLRREGTTTKDILVDPIVPFTTPVVGVCTKHHTAVHLSLKQRHFEAGRASHHMFVFWCKSGHFAAHQEVEFKERFQQATISRRRNMTQHKYFKVLMRTLASRQ